MSAVDHGRNNTPIRQRTLLDIIRDDRSTKDKKSWKTFRDKLRLKRAGSAFTSTVRVPASDVNVQTTRSRSLRRQGSYHLEDGGGERDPPGANNKMQLARRDSVRFGNNKQSHDDSVDDTMPSDAPPSRRPQMTRHPSTRYGAHNDDEDNSVDGSDDDDEDHSPKVEDIGPRSLSAREAVAAQEAAEAAAMAETGAGEETSRISLMDLLGETGYSMGGAGDGYDDGGEEDDDDVESSSGGMEYTCNVCMVMSKGSALIPCGHTFCRLCSRELTVQRGNCPLCNGYIIEILAIF